MRTRSPGLNCGSILPLLRLSGRRARFNPAIDLRTRQESLLNYQGLNGGDPALIIAHRLIVPGWNALDSAPEFIDTDDALITTQDPHHGIGPFLPHGVVVLGSLHRPGLRPAAPIMHMAHILPPRYVAWSQAPVAV